MKFPVISFVFLCSYVFSTKGHVTQTCQEAFPDGCHEGMFPTGLDECYHDLCEIEECCLGLCGQNGGVDSWISDSICDDINNNEICDFDGGDCCVCTCTVLSYDLCDYFDCKDPESSCPSQTCEDAFPGGCETMFKSDSFYSETCQTDHCEISECCVGLCDSKGGVEEWISDGICDHVNNIPECDNDGGDCCECTCENSYILSYEF